MTSVRLFFLLGAVLAGLGVGLGAFGAHGLRNTLSADDLSTFEVGVRYQMYHALALFIVAWAATRWDASTAIAAAGWLFVAGIVLFSGSLYFLVLSGPRWLVAVTPFGGVAFLAGWAALAWGVWQGTSVSS
jgi:uncharacterized membrane protein YgdD (TMEM256/DUF423 family)